MELLKNLTKYPTDRESIWKWVCLVSLYVLLTFLFFLVSEVLGHTELAKGVTSTTGVQSYCLTVLLCKYVLIHDWCGNSVLFLLVNTCTKNPELMATPGNVPLFQALNAFTEKIEFSFQFKISSLLHKCFCSLDIVLNSNIYHSWLSHVITGLATWHCAVRGIFLSKKKEFLRQIFWLFNRSNKGNIAWDGIIIYYWKHLC